MESTIEYESINTGVINHNLSASRRPFIGKQSQFPQRVSGRALSGITHRNPEQPDEQQVACPLP